MILVGFQAPGTRGFDLAQGTRLIKALGRYVSVKCDIEVFQGMSVHADADELLTWLSRCSTEHSRPDICYVVHGEEDAALTLVDRICDELGWLAVAPRAGEIVRVD